jgi:hypothetical protein
VKTSVTGRGRALRADRSGPAAGSTAAAWRWPGLAAGGRSPPRRRSRRGTATRRRPGTRIRTGTARLQDPKAGLPGSIAVHRGQRKRRSDLRKQSTAVKGGLPRSTANGGAEIYGGPVGASREFQNANQCAWCDAALPPLRSPRPSPSHLSFLVPQLPIAVGPLETQPYRLPHPW